ncbi:MAG: hypothetical protein J6Y37_06950 [Paludibacteraceae bacterium]|nr:hypothetical protein [Paludibacteraceae bacterium]
MITPTEIKKKAENKYVAYLQSIVEGNSFQPIVIAGDKRPNSDTVKFDQELAELINHSKEKKGYGYSVEYQTVKTKQHGKQDIPTVIRFQTEVDYLKYINKEKETKKFREDIANIKKSFPELKDWIYKYPNKVIENEWTSLLKVCRYFKNNPVPRLYIRELPINVHTKFIENNKGIIKELLDIIIGDYVNADEKQFEVRFNLKFDEPIVRFRILDKTVSQSVFAGVTDLSIPISQFQLLSIPIQIVYIVENKINMLSFPIRNDSIVIWGHGFGIEVLKNVEWLNSKHIYYWGDIDAQGFEILSQVRTYFPSTQSFMMDKETFERFNENDKGTKSNVATELNLSKEELELYDYLKNNDLRLEQEKIPFDYVVRKIPFET